MVAIDASSLMFPDFGPIMAATAGIDAGLEARGWDSM